MVNTTGNSTIDSTQNDIRNISTIIILGLILIAFIFFSVCGNILVVLAVIKTPYLREDKSNSLVINLAITDMLNGSTVMLSTFIATVTDTHTVSYFLCNLICVANYCLIIASMMTLCFISVDRLYAIIFPLTYIQSINNKVLAIAIIWSWIQGVAFAVVPYIEDWVEYDYWEITCAIQWHKKGDDAIYYVVVAFLLCFLGPGLVLAFNYIKILREAKKKMKIWAVTYQTTQDKDMKKKVKKQSASAKTVRSLLIVVCAYFVCMTPFSVTKLIKVSVVNPIIPGQVNTMASLFAFGSSVVNPMIYGIFRKDFRKAFKNIIRKRVTTLGVNRNIPNTSTIEFSNST